MKQIENHTDAGFLRRRRIWIAALLIGLAMPAGVSAAAQSSSPSTKSTSSSTQPGTANDPASVVAGILATACRQDVAKFPEYLSATNGTFYRKLTPGQQVGILRRLVLLDNPGRALLSTDADGSTEIRCETPSTTRQIHLGTPRTDQNISFVPIDVKPDRSIDFGLVASSGGWKLISLGLLMLDLAQLQPEWDAQDMANREDVATKSMYKIWAAIDTYRKAFEKVPESLGQLGPAPKEGISPDAAGLLTAELASGTVAGYAIRYRIIPTGAGGAETEFELAATPAEYGKTGKRSFFMDNNGKLRGGDKMGAPATAADPLIDEGSPQN